jgi:subtilisin family serine protease
MSRNFPILLLLASTASVCAQAPPKKVVTTESDLPRFSYPVVESVIPSGAKVKMTGTSMAAPQVTNLAAKLLAIDPRLSPA